MSTIDRCPAHLFKFGGKWKYEVFLDCTGKLRGLLCGPCNKALAWFETYAENAARYLNHA